MRVSECVCVCVGVGVRVCGCVCVCVCGWVGAILDLTFYASLCECMCE